MPPSKPLKQKAYGSIPHLPGSRRGPGDHGLSDEQAQILTTKARDRYDYIVVQEKLDGSCTAIAKLNNQIVALIRAGYLATDSPYPQHHEFARWVTAREQRFAALLAEGERCVGEWLMEAHGTRYCLDPNTPILFSDLTWRLASSVIAGSELVGFDEHCSPDTNCRRWKRSTVLDVGTVKLPSYRVTLEDGTKLVSSGDHLWLTKASSMVKWTRTDRLRSKNSVTARGSSHLFPSKLCRVIDPWPVLTSWNSGYVAGVFDGEGSVSQMPRQGRDYGHHFTISFAQKNNAVAKKTAEILTELGVDHSKSRNGSGTNNDVFQFQVNGGTAGKLRFLGMVRPFRLLEKFNVDRLGQMEAKDYVAVEHVEPIGMVDLVTFGTSTKTFIANGFGSHNCLPHEPFVIFDLMRQHKRTTTQEVYARSNAQGFTTPRIIHTGSPIDIPTVLTKLEPSGHGALDPVEGAVWRVERNNTVDFLGKYVRPEKVDGQYFLT